MKDGTRPSEQVEVSRQEVYEDYMKCYLQQCTEVRPCRDAGLLKKAARYLLTKPEPRENFTTFPFYQALSEGCLSLNTDYRKLLSAFIKAVELLETICVNLYLQPWKKEIKTLKVGWFFLSFLLQPLPHLTGNLRSIECLEFKSMLPKSFSVFISDVK